MGEDDKMKNEELGWVDEILKDIHKPEEPASAEENDPEQESVQEEPPSGEEAPAEPEPAAPPPKKPRIRFRTRVKRVGYLNTVLYVLISVAICAAASIISLKAVGDVLAISRPDKAVEVVIPHGTGVEQLGEIYEEAGLIEYPWVFNIVAKYEKMGTIAPGTYVLNCNMGYNSLMKAVKKSNKPPKTVNVTIPEGMNLVEISKLLEQKNICSAGDFMRAVENTTFEIGFQKEIPESDMIFYRFEGYLFPDTYQFYEDTNALNVVKRMMDNFEKKITPAIRAQMVEQKMSLHELITLASIIQGEAPDKENMAMVSSVYRNRLENPDVYPKLQADPTRKYATEVIKDAAGISGRKIVDAYNTYEGNGLPPGPINNPGSDAIYAALNPADTPYFYFCSNLKTRKFYYAETYNEHERNLVRANLK